MRNPNSTAVDRLNMPRGLGDDFTSLDQSESDPSVSPTSRAFLSVTRVQYALLKAWAENNFKGEWDLGGDIKYIPIPAPNPNPTPHGLTIAALESCVGGPFFPGIEVSWLIRETQLYIGAFRLKEPGFVLGQLTLGPGFFSQQMALPWQADFYDCHKEDHTPDGASDKLIYMWWTAQRPDEIRPDASSPWRRWVPWQVVMQRGIESVLQVDTLTQAVRGDEDTAFFLREFGDFCAAFVVAQHPGDGRNADIGKLAAQGALQSLGDIIGGGDVATPDDGINAFTEKAGDKLGAIGELGILRR